MIDGRLVDEYHYKGRLNKYGHSNPIKISDSHSPKVNFGIDKHHNHSNNYLSIDHRQGHGHAHRHEHEHEHNHLFNNVNNSEFSGSHHSRNIQSTSGHHKNLDFNGDLGNSKVRGINGMKINHLENQLYESKPNLDNLNESNSIHESKYELKNNETFGGEK